MKSTIQEIESNITDVIVYLSGAQVTRKAQFIPVSETSEIVFRSLSYTLRPESIQVSADDGVSILSVEHKIDYLKEADKSAEIEKMQNELKSLKDKLIKQKSQIELCELEENFFKDNSSLAGTETGLKASELKEAVLFYMERMENIRQKRIACDKEIEGLNEQITQIENQLGSYSAPRQFPVSNVTVKIAAEKENPANLSLTYYVPSASWQPSYDVQAKDTQSPVSLHYKARVSQNTNENWDDVKLTLSTGNPSVNGECPDMKPWYIDFYSEPDNSHFQSFKAEPMASELRRTSISKEAGMEDLMDMVAELSAPASLVSESLTSVEYTVNEPYSIASGDGGQSVEIITHSMPAKYRYFSARKLEKEVFLLASIRDWEHLNLVAGEASIFFENRYIGKTFIDPRRADEEINLSLGVDKSVVVTRVRGKDFTEKTFTGGSIKQTRQWELTVRNLKNVPVDIKVVDQIPVSRNKQITVEATETSGAELNEDMGILTWELTLEPAAAKKMSVKYIVTHPKNTAVVLE